jgi:phosphoglycolate phosphatase
MLRRALDLTGGGSAAELDLLFPVLLDYYAANIAVHTQLYPGGAAMLDALEAAGVRVALVTNKRHAMAVKLLDALDLSHRFGWIMGGGNGYPLKPAPEVLWAMAEQLGGGRAAYVGDTTFDTRAARAAGMPCVAVRFGFNDLPADQLGADAVIDHFDDLIPALLNL